MSRVRRHLLDNCTMCKTVLIDCSCSWGEFYVWFYAHAMIGMVLVVNTLLLCPLFRANCCSISSAFTVMSWWFITYLFYCFILFCSCQNIQIFHVAKQIPRSNIQKRKQTVHQFCTTTTTTDWRQRLWLVVWSCAFCPIAFKTYRSRSFVWWMHGANQAPYPGFDPNRSELPQKGRWYGMECISGETFGSAKEKTTVHSDRKMEVYRPLVTVPPGPDARALSAGMIDINYGCISKTNLMHLLPNRVQSS